MSADIADTLKAASPLQINVVANGFAVHDRPDRGYETPKMWVFTDAWQLGAWLRDWGLIHHPEPDFDGCCGADRDPPGASSTTKASSTSFNFSVSAGRYIDFRLTSDTPGRDVFESLRILRSYHWQRDGFRITDSNGGTVTEQQFHTFPELLVYIISEYPGLMSGRLAASLLTP